jgi:hypothetical protein
MSGETNVFRGKPDPSAGLINQPAPCSNANQANLLRLPWSAKTDRAWLSRLPKSADPPG